MGNALSTTPKLPDAEYETPWGTATVKDVRSYRDADDMYERVAYLELPNVVINGKEYGRVGMYLRHHPAMTGQWESERYGAVLTPAAGKVWREFWKEGADTDPFFAPYLCPLDPGAIFAGQVDRALYEMGNFAYNASTVNKCPDEALDEAVKRFMEKRSQGIKWDDIRRELDK